MKAYLGKFIKKDGTEREMTFVRICDIPSEFLEEIVGNSGREKVLPEGMELVYDLEADGFRTFNHNKIVEGLREVEVENPFFT